MPDELHLDAADIDGSKCAPTDVIALDRLLGIHGSDKPGRCLLGREACWPLRADRLWLLDIGVGDEDLLRLCARHRAEELVDVAFSGRTEKGDGWPGKPCRDRQVDVAAQRFVHHLKVLGRIAGLDLGNRGELVVLERNPRQVFQRGVAMDGAIVGDEQVLIGKRRLCPGQKSHADQRHAERALGAPESRSEPCAGRNIQHCHDVYALWSDAGHCAASCFLIIPNPMSLRDTPL